MAKTASSKSKKTAEAKPKATAKSKKVEAQTVENDGNIKEVNIENVVEKKLIALFSLQKIHTEIDKIRILRGELPLEVQDLEDEIAGLHTRIENFELDVVDLETEIKNRKSTILESKALIEKYEKQKLNVRNNREFDSLTKEVEFQELEIELCEKKIKTHADHIDNKKAAIEGAKQVLTEREADKEVKNSELDNIIAEHNEEENKLQELAAKHTKNIEERLFVAFDRIRRNAKNGLGVVVVERDACGGCFNKIPPQVQLDIRTHKRVIICEYCGRILIDDQIETIVNEQLDL